MNAADANEDFPTYLGPQKTLILAFVQRSGSHFLGHLLYSSGQLGYPLEYFHRRHWADWQARAGSSDPHLVIGTIRSHRTSPSGVFSLKIARTTLRRVHSTELVSLFDDAIVVLMRRSDRLAQAVSWAIAKQNRTFLNEIPDPSTLTYSAEAIAERLRLIGEHYAAWETFLRDRRITPIEVNYEACCDDPLPHVRRIADAIGADIDLGLVRPLTMIQRTSINQEWQERYLRE